MSIKPIDITSKSFASKFKGYDKDQVDDFLDQIALDVEKLVSENRELEKQAKQAEEKLSYFNELKDSLNQSIIVAQDTADKLKENATKESDLAIQQAQAQSEDILAHANKMSEELITGSTNKANQILLEASERARQLAVETDDLKKKTRVFHRNLSVLLESQLQIVKSGEWDELLKPFGAYVDSSHTAFREVLDAVESANSSDPTAVAIEVKPEFKETTEIVLPEEKPAKKEDKVKEETKKGGRPERASRSRVK
ncbi:DivIVA domain-containing protein [Vagococcus hydrophili]|uniref:DivIVA domain-containing protein n=1 Tax=Vagococcus hydrophili TaxID=2714947 RepID=A0A6G8AR21_9ENTE|nr:DivIVA domain-containing protein [Vagococcus hydrophili]QIL47521.1 DivIVA domain-containing protein [Vagococcus hydrophili]